MERSESTSFFHGVRFRELNGSRVRKRPYISNVALDFKESGVVSLEHNGDQTPPLAVSFCKSSRNSHIIAVSDEEGYVSLFNTRHKFSTSASYQENTEKARICDWVAHNNAVFDLCWIKEDSQILTASGDQTMKIWDIHEKKCIGVLMGHTGSVKSMSSHPTNPDVLVSGSRDGLFAIWDLRSNSCSKMEGRELCICPSAEVKGAHTSSQAKRVRRGKAASMSITSVLYLKDEFSIATAGAIDSVVKFWDTRNMKSSVTKTCPHPKTTDKESRLHGISSLSQDLSGTFLSASCMDNRIYLYNILQLEKGPVKSFSGCRIESFYVKSALSSDASYMLSGSSDGNAYIWQVNNHEEDPIKLKNHDGEVTAVDWCSSEVGKIATAADDFTVRLWNTHTSDSSSTRSPSSIRRRVMAVRNTECRELLTNEPTHTTKAFTNLLTSDEDRTELPKVGTPEPQEKVFSSVSVLDETFEKFPEASPSSVLNPPSSIKRKTIRDYFLAS